MKTPLIVHVIHRFQVGGLENGLVNLINNLPAKKYRHAIICMAESTDFEKRIQKPDVKVYALHKKDGKDISVYFRLWRLLRSLKPAIVHSRNISTLETPVVAALAGVPVRIHGEHGRDIFDLHGDNRKYQKLRKWVSPFTSIFITMSKDLEYWLHTVVGIQVNKITQLYNGVDTDRFFPVSDKQSQRRSMPDGFDEEGITVIGTVGRLEPVKDQLTLVKAFIRLLKHFPENNNKLRLILLGDGILRSKIENLVEDAGIEKLVWLPGSRNDVPEILRSLDIFVLPSLGEGISNTILEAMACGLPVVATKVGGNVELVQDGITGALVMEDDPQTMALAINSYVVDKNLQVQHGAAARQRVETVFSLQAMIKAYQCEYDKLLSRKRII